MSNFYQIHSYNPVQLERRFQGADEIKSKYEPKFPLTVEREYKRLGRDLQRDFDSYIEPLIVVALMALENGTMLSDTPPYIPQVDIEARINRIADQLERFAIRQDRKSVV